MGPLGTKALELDAEYARIVKLYGLQVKPHGFLMALGEPDVLQSYIRVSSDIAVDRRESLRCVEERLLVELKKIVRLVQGDIDKMEGRDIMQLMASEMETE